MNGFALSIESPKLVKIAEKIWENECHKSLEGLTFWNRKENFPSLGIGHFIWFPEKVDEPFEETFPLLCQFLEKKGLQLPLFIKRACPWNTRDDFYRDFHSEEMEELRVLLFETKDLQAEFMAERLQNALPRMLEGLNQNEKDKVADAFNALLNHPQGLYPLLDYLNFKGAGTSVKERYKGLGWGLQQVLLEISCTHDVVEEFMEGAKTVLKRRVANAPKDESHFLKGWLKRVESYSEEL